LCADPYVADPSLVSAEEAIERADIVILGAPHAVYRNLEIPPQKLAIDVWGVWPAENSSRKEVRANASVGRS
jgi:UDP-N-acetyl-D-mannosaminuronic acid dehydrogenase